MLEKLKVYLDINNLEYSDDIMLAANQIVLQTGELINYSRFFYFDYFNQACNGTMNIEDFFVIGDITSSVNISQRVGGIQSVFEIWTLLQNNAIKNKTIIVDKIAGEYFKKFSSLYYHQLDGLLSDAGSKIFYV